MEGAPIPTPPAGGSPMYNPPPPPMPPAPAPAAPAATPVMAEGGTTGSGGGSGFTGKVKEFFSDINLLDVAISAFIVGGVLYAVHYYKFMMMMEKTGYADLSTRVQRLESQMAAAKKNAEANAAGNGRMQPMRRKRALVTL